MPSSCGCEFLDSQALFRATVVEVLPERSSAVFLIDEVLVTGDSVTSTEAGDFIETSTVRFVPSAARQQICPSATVEVPAVGESVLLSVRYIVPNCANCDAGSDAGLVGARSWVLPWQDSYDFGGKVLTPAELVPLTEPGACRAPFPLLPLGECDDTVETEVGPFGCSR
jgi:hypothetical protein